MERVSVVGNLLDYRSPVRFFYAIGEKDQDNRRQFSDEFVNQAAAYGVSVERKIYPNTGHSFTPQMEDEGKRIDTVKEDGSECGILGEPHIDALTGLSCDLLPFLIFAF